MLRKCSGRAAVVEVVQELAQQSLVVVITHSDELRLALAPDLHVEI